MKKAIEVRWSNLVVGFKRLFYLFIFFLNSNIATNQPFDWENGLISNKEFLIVKQKQPTNQKLVY